MWARLFLSLSLALAVTAKRGDGLFQGKEPLSGRIRGHESALPAETVRCVNCHGPQARTAPGLFAAPRIDASLLLEARRRRGGPPSSYDQPAFCQLLRTGVDPAHIVIAREMPVYDLSDDQCASLWRFFLEKESIHATR